jgi:hypothetical protein
MICSATNDVVRFSDWETHQMGDYDAETCFSKSLKIFTDAEIDSERARTLSEWARYKFKSGDREKGTAMWQEARDIYATLGAQLEVERMNTLPE